MDISLPQFPESYWRASTTERNYPILSEDKSTDVCVVGGGITGITTAYLLAKQGKRVVLIEADKLFSGATGFTTAKVTAQHGLIYDELRTNFGIEKAELYYRQQLSALHFIKRTVQAHQIDCALSNQDAYIYTNSESALAKLQSEFQMYQSLKIDSAYLEAIPLPLPVKGAIVMKNQAQFHPLQYLTKLAEALMQAGGEIYEHTVAVKTAEKPTHVLTKDCHKIKCEHIVVCSHFPFIDKMGFYFARMHAEKSYVVAIKSSMDFPGGMYINSEKPTRSIRQMNFNGESLLLIGGETHITARDDATIDHYETLNAFANAHFSPTAMPYRWSTQDLLTIDKLPFIGPITAGDPKLLVATGYRKWGMTNGTVAAQLLTNIILNKKDDYGDLVAPSRLSFSSIKNLATNVKEMAKELVGGKLGMVIREPEDLAVDEGDVVLYKGKRAGAYRDADNQLHIVDTTCTHMGCELMWNSGERSWDCPCHGSRFDKDGEVLEGPAKKQLKKFV